jgi:phenylalanyl-tRNA synthetase alpha chain
MSDAKTIDYKAIEAKWLAAATAAGDAPALETIRVEALGKKGEISQLMKGLGALDPEQRREAGQQLNRIKDEVQAAIEQRRAALEEAGLETKLATERIDVTLPPRPESEGRLHPISQTIDEIVAIFGEMGFQVAEGPDIEDDFHNFTALNIPPDHPARQMHDTFYLASGSGRPTSPVVRGGSESGAVVGDSEHTSDNGAGGAAVGAREDQRLLRTHTSPVQIRHMKDRPPPIRIIAPGRTYRNDSDMTHTPMFHQVEGLVIDATTHMGHLKGCLVDFCRAFFGIPDLPLRFRPSFFPFTEPSAEVDIGCSRKGGELKLGNHGDWLEILGCGMVHPKVLEMSGIDPTRYQGFAFGMGIERIAMLKYGIPDLRTFFEADLRWLRHYGFAPLDVPSLTGGIAR